MAVPGDVLRSAVECCLDLHLNPEPSGAERRTAGVLAERLTADGYAVTRGVGGHGVVGLLRRGDGPTVLLRAELDALRVRETSGLRYASTVPGVAHACGHDVHLAALAGAARMLARDTDGWRGTVAIVGQPAEETLGGALAMLRDGLFELTGRPDVVLAQHTAPLPAGTLAHADGPLLAGTLAVDAVLHGTGGHAGAPHLAVDPVVLAAAAVLRLQTLVARECAPAEQAVLTVGRLAAGVEANVIPDRAELGISLRAFDGGTLERLLAGVRRVLAAEAEASGAPRAPEVAVRARSHPLRADRSLTSALRAAHAEAFGAGRVLTWQPATAAEDFGWFGPAGAEVHGGADIRLGYWMLGTVSAAARREAAETGRPIPGNHAPDFAPDLRTTLPTGIEALTSAARLALRGAGVPAAERGAARPGAEPVVERPAAAGDFDRPASAPQGVR
ncbi:amidohydrolase [Streptomyces sp. 3MP-14]|uniref:Amidohydrolase n=1 Tax=Streptomyces mimosae TaxID=2586635 RepID=A0A5N6AE71_9ACTN|nr:MULTISPECIES: amidohydrolase [Streptomyces]KAB8166266.1 amidohydrolase [Streptomyces mimosae]KAB8174059.1 amidohydrolase [Streptomyces sp. 3MP-14]